MADPTPATRRGFLDSLSGRTVLLSLLIAAIAAVVTVAVSIPLINGAARAQAQATLDRVADVTVAALQQSSAPGSADRVQDLLASQQISAYLIGTGLRPAPGLSVAQQREVLAGTSLDTEVAIRDLFQAPTIASLAEREGDAAQASARPALRRMT